MEPEPEKQQSEIFEPSRAFRLAYWLAIYCASVYFYMAGQSAKYLPGYNPISDFWYNAVHFPDNVQFLFMGLFRLPYGSFYCQAAGVLAYACFLIDLALCFKFTGIRSFWILISFLVILLTASAYGCAYRDNLGIVRMNDTP